MTERSTATDDGRRVSHHPRLGPLPPVELVEFTFDGHPITARAGEPIAAALLAAGIRVWRTMPRTGEARGGWCLVGRCADCQVIVDGCANVRACLTTVATGMTVRRQEGLGDGVWQPLADDEPEPGR